MSLGNMLIFKHKRGQYVSTHYNMKSSTHFCNDLKYTQFTTSFIYIHAQSNKDTVNT